MPAQRAAGRERRGQAGRDRALGDASGLEGGGAAGAGTAARRALRGSCTPAAVGLAVGQSLHRVNASRRVVRSRADAGRSAQAQERRGGGEAWLAPPPQPLPLGLRWCNGAA